MLINLRFLILIALIELISINYAFTSESKNDFDKWLLSFKKTALKKGISQQTLELAFNNVKYLEKVIKYDRKQPEFFEDTITYVSKRANILRANKAKKLLKKKQKII